MLKQDNEWYTAKYSEIIKFIKDEHHSNWQKELPEIDYLVYKILRVHYSDSGEELTQVHKLFGKLKNRLELILVMKQVSLYPDILNYQREDSTESLEDVTKDITNMENEYDDIIENLKELRNVTNGYTMPEPGCQTFKTTYKKLEELEINVLQSISIEKKYNVWKTKSLNKSLIDGSWFYENYCY